MRIFDIMLKDLSQILRDRKSFLFLLAMPIMFTIFMGFAYRGSQAAPDPRLPVGWINQDPSGKLSLALHDSLAGSDSLRLVEFDPAQGTAVNQQVSSGKLAGALLIPAGFSQQAMSGAGPQITLVVDPASVTGQSVLELVRVPVTRMMSSVEVASLHTAGLPAAQQGQAEKDAAFQQATDQWQQLAQTGPQIVAVRAQGKPADQAPFGGNPYNQASPGILVMFAIFSLVTSATIVVQERKLRTMERMLTTSLNRASLVAGHLLAMFILTLMQQVILVVFGQLILKVDYFRQPLGTLLVMAAVAVWAASLGLLIGVLAKEEQRVTLYSLIAMFILSALGGTWFPLETSGPAFAAIGRLTPTSWAMTGFQNILLRGLDSASALLPAAVLLAYTALFFGVAVWRFNKDH